MNTKIPVTVVTGFLGAGKTSLVCHLLEQIGERRIALIVNEFGDIGVDGELLAACNIPGCDEGDIIELANGCLCCTVAHEFIPTIEALINRENPPDHILIETSGLALPKPLIKAFQWPSIHSKVTLDSIVAMADAASIADGRFADDPCLILSKGAENLVGKHNNPLEAVFEQQVLCADLVILNKTDLVDMPTLEKVRADLTAMLNPGVKIIEASYGRVSPQIVLGLDAATEKRAHKHAHQHDHLEEDGHEHKHDDDDDHHHEEFESFAIRFPSVTDVDALEERLRSAIVVHDILRLKGFVAVDGKSARHIVQAVGTRIERYFDRPWKDTELRESSLIVIGHRGMNQIEITRTILEHAPTPKP